MRRYFTLAIYLIILSSCSRCQVVHDRDGDGVLDSKDKCPSVYGKTKDGCPKEISNVNFFLETSESMKGYMANGSDFANFIPSLLSDIENRIEFKDKPLQINFISDSIIPYNKGIRDFIKDISTTEVANKESSEMDKIFQMVTNRTDSNDISLFVSDLSYLFQILRFQATIKLTDKV